MMTLSQAAQAVDGLQLGEDVHFSSVCSDSRKLMQGDLFIALQGEYFDGYGYIVQAIKSGAVAAMVNKESYEAKGIEEKYSSFPVLAVEDTRLALGQLAAYWRKQFAIPLVAITGSNGKTTVKEMLASILRVAAGKKSAVLATTGNLNNDIGMPLMLLRLNAEHRYAVIEIGMNHPREIDTLTRIACPDVALINNAGDAHLEGLGSVHAVAEAKGEIFTGLTEKGTAIINSDDVNAPLWRALVGGNPLLEFGFGRQADVSGNWQANKSGMQIEVQAPQGNFTAKLNMLGEHNVCNALAATTAAIALNIPLETIVLGLERFTGVAGRLQRKTTMHGTMLIDDTYNANPASARAAIRVLAQVSGKRVLVLGDMGELGEQAVMLHTEIGNEARKAGIEKLYTLGKLSGNAAKAFGSGRHFDCIEDLQFALEKELDRNSVVLVKGSRFMKMERVVQFLKTGTTDDVSRLKEKSCS